jgi:3',5'-cyclic AMP phosphodiesterase CpdA
VPTRILHVSDLHVGARGDDVLERALGGLAARIAPTLVIASGDLTHHGRRQEHERAASILRGLDLPVLAVPGNHDIPHAFPARFTSPWAEFERAWGTVEPTYSADGVHVVGINSVRPWRHQSGGIDQRQLMRVTERLGDAPPGALRVAVLHHQLINAPWRTRKRPVARRGHVLATLAGAGAELILGGHIHQAALSERHEFEVDSGAGVLAVAPGLGQPRPRRRGEARGAIVYGGDSVTITADTYIWRGNDWGLTATRNFPRGGEPLVEG